MTRANTVTANLCGARKRQGEGTCARPAGWGTDHLGVGRCKLHGGSTPNHVAAAAPAMLAKAAAAFGMRVEGQPLDVLLDALALASGYEQWLRVTLETEKADMADPRMVVWERALERRAKIAAECVARGVEVAVVNAQQRVAESFVRLLDRLLPKLGVATTDDVIEIVAGELRSSGFGGTA